MYFKETIADASKYSDKVVKILKDQKQKYDLLKKLKFDNNLYNHIYENKMLIPANALVHGTLFDEETLLKIKKEGILSSEFARNKPDMYNETFYMADFFKNCTGKSMSVMQLLTCNTSEKLMQYLPSDKNDSKNFQIAFIVNTENEKIKKYLERDLFASNNLELLEFIDEEFCYSLNRRKYISHYSYKLGQSSIPIGVPYSALSGVIVGDWAEKENCKKFSFLQKVFGKDLFIISSNGKILNRPKEYTLDL